MPGPRPDRSRSGDSDPRRASDAQAEDDDFEKEVAQLRTQISFLEEEISSLRRRLTDSPRHVRILEDRLPAAPAPLARGGGQNEKLASTLREARDQILSLKEEVDRLAQPPSGYGIFLEAFPDEGTADV